MHQLILDPTGLNDLPPRAIVALNGPTGLSVAAQKGADGLWRLVGSERPFNSADLVGSTVFPALAVYNPNRALRPRSEELARAWEDGWNDCDHWFHDGEPDTCPGNPYK